MARFVAVIASSKVALQDTHGDVAFDTLGALALRFSDELGSLRGQRVALLATKNRCWVAGFWSILLCGGTVVPLSPDYPAAERLALLQQSGVQLLLISNDIALAQEELQALSGMRLRVQEIPRRGQRQGSRTSASFDAPSLAQAPPGEKKHEDSPAMMLFTSGTTGRPKGVLVSHRNLYDGLCVLADAWDWQTEDCLLHILPLHHLHGICVALLLSFLCGTPTILESRFKPRRVVRYADRATVLMGVPSSHKLLLDEYALQSKEVQRVWCEKLRRYRLITSGSAKLPLTVGEDMRRLTGQYPLERYGMTEIGIVVSNPVAGQRRPGSAGKPLPGVELRIVDDTGKPVKKGESGEVWVRGSTVFSAYADDQAATEAAFSQGFFRTGDTARWLTDGYIELLGRNSVDILKSGGYKISALEIEEALRANADVSEVSVVGLPDETWGQKIAAVIVPREGRQPPLTEASVQEWLRRRIVGYKVPRRIQFVGQLPRNAMGKVVKPKVVSQFFS